MLLARYDEGKMSGSIHAAAPLVVTKENARKAFFYKSNLHGRAGNSAGKRLRQSAWQRRGNVFTGMWNVQRVVVKINPVRNRTKGVGAGAGSGAKNLQAHVRYISRSGAGKDESKAELFDRDQEEVDGKGFYEACKDDRHHFRMIISPENGHAIEDFRGYVRSVMGKVEKDLGTKLSWVAAVHYDTDDIHAHVIIRGVHERGEDLVIGRDYISSGIRGRAQEVATELLGERSLEEIQKSTEREVEALRVTSLDRFIERQVKDGRIDVRSENNFGKSSHYEGLLKKRLAYLGAAGLATEHPPGVFVLKEGYRDTLSQIAQRDDVIKRLYKRVDTGLDGLDIYSLKAGQGKIIEGRVIDKGPVDEITDRKYVLMQSAAGLHYVPLGEGLNFEELDKGSLIRVRPGDGSTGKADFNISLIAKKNGGIYDTACHRAYIEKEMGYIAADERDGYLRAHAKRLDTLCQNGIVGDLDDGRYEVPEDVIAQGKEVTRKINERERKRFYPRLDVLSAQPVEGLVTAARKTWLDKELYKQSKGKVSDVVHEPGVKKALEARKDWLLEHDLAMIQSGGGFALRPGALLKLDKLEVHMKGHALAQKAGLTFNERKIRSGQVLYYLGAAELETGLWAVAASDKALQMARIKERPAIERGAQVSFTELEDEKGVFVMSAVPRGKEAVKQREKDQDFDKER